MNHTHLQRRLALGLTSRSKITASCQFVKNFHVPTKTVFDSSSNVGTSSSVAVDNNKQPESLSDKQWRPKHFRPASEVVPGNQNLLQALELAAQELQNDAVNSPEFTHYHVTLRRSSVHSRNDIQDAVKALGLRWVNDRTLVPIHPTHAGNLLKLKDFITVRPLNVIKDLHWEELERLILAEVHYRASAQGIRESQVHLSPETSVLRIHRKRPSNESIGFSIKRRLSDAVANAPSQKRWDGGLSSLENAESRPLTAVDIARLKGLFDLAKEKEEKDIFILEN